MSCRSCKCLKCRKCRETKESPKKTAQEYRKSATLSHAIGVLWKKVTKDFERLAESSEQKK